MNTKKKIQWYSDVEENFMFQSLKKSLKINCIVNNLILFSSPKLLEERNHQEAL